MRLRVALILGLWLIWEALARSGLVYQGVVPSSLEIGAALWNLVGDNAFYYNLSITGYEVAMATAIGTIAGIATGLLLGASRFSSQAFEPYLYCIGPTPKIVFFPVLMLMFGAESGSKVAMGVISCFFPISLSVAAGVRQIDRVLIRVGRSFHASTWQMVRKVYLPALVPPLINGIRLGLGVAIVGVLMSETKLSNRGLGFMAIQDYAHFQIPEMYAILIVIFTLAMLLNSLVARIGMRYGVGRARG